MGRIRTIKPEFPESETIGKLSREARLLFILLWTLVDDEGRSRAASRFLASSLYPYDEDSVKHIDGWLAELSAQQMVDRYVVDGSTYLQVRNWLKHQKIDHPTVSKLPAPPPDSPNPRESSRILAPDLDLGPRTLDLKKPLIRGKRGSQGKAADPRHKPFRDDVHGFWQQLNGQELAPWGPAEAKQLALLLSANPRLTRDEFRAMLEHRARSPGVNRSDPPHLWLHSLPRFLANPLDRFNRPLEGANA